MKAALKKLVPKALLSAMELQRETRSLAALTQSACDTSNLRREVPDFLGRHLETEWDSARDVLAQLQIEDKLGAINPGDRRAIYYLTRALSPASILEVGTHLGASTTVLSLAMKQSGRTSTRLVSVDILDVNGPNGAWARLGSKHSPRTAVAALNCDFVEFVTSPSLPFLAGCKERFDLIFLDGGHEAATVYQEVPAALRLLKPNGLILLHDFYPQRKPLWNDGVVVMGPWLAVERLVNEGARVTVKPLGALPWPTKLGSSVTSLACLIAT